MSFSHILLLSDSFVWQKTSHEKREESLPQCIFFEMIIGSDADFTLAQNISTVFCVVYFIYFLVAKHAQQGFCAKKFEQSKFRICWKKSAFSPNLFYFFDQIMQQNLLNNSQLAFKNRSPWWKIWEMFVLWICKYNHYFCFRGKS